MRKKIFILCILLESLFSPVKSMAAPGPAVHPIRPAPHLSRDWTVRQYGDDRISEYVLMMNIAAPHIRFSRDSCVHIIPSYLLHHISDTAHSIHAIKVYSDHAAPVTVVDLEFPATPTNRETVREVEALANSCPKLEAVNPQDIFGYKVHTHGSSVRSGSSTEGHLTLTNYSAQGAVLVTHQGHSEINYDGKVQGVIGESHRKFFIVGQATPFNEKFIDLSPWIRIHQ